MKVCGNDLAKFTAALKLRLAIDDSHQVTVIARVKSGADINIQDQIQANDSLSDFLCEVLSFRLEHSKCQVSAAKDNYAIVCAF